MLTTYEYAKIHQYYLMGLESEVVAEILGIPPERVAEEYNRLDAEFDIWEQSQDVEFQNED